MKSLSLALFGALLITSGCAVSRTVSMDQVDKQTMPETAGHMATTIPTQITNAPPPFDPFRGGGEF